MNTKITFLITFAVFILNISTFADEPITLTVQKNILLKQFRMPLN